MEKDVFDPAIEKGTNEEVVKGIAKVAKSISETISPYNIAEEKIDLNGDAFKVCKTNLPEKTGFWTKFKNVLFYEVKVELTPYQQKVEEEVNEFLHQEITLKKVKDFFFQEIKF